MINGKLQIPDLIYKKFVKHVNSWSDLIWLKCKLPVSIGQPWGTVLSIWNFTIKIIFIYMPDMHWNQIFCTSYK